MRTSCTTAHDTGRLQNTTYACWNHPVDVCFSCTGLLGWPKFFIELFFLDDDDRIDFGTSAPRQGCVGV